MEYRILGPVEVRAAGVRIHVGGVRERRALATLVLSANCAVSVDRLVDVLWGEDPPPTVAAQVRNTMATLRRNMLAAGVGAAPFARCGSGFVLHASEDAIDALSVNRLVGQARALAGRGERAAAAGLLRTALDLWRGPVLGGVGDALEAERQALEEQRLTTWEQRIELDLELGRHQDLATELALLVGSHPTRERLVELYLLALHRAGRRQDALDAYSLARARLAELLGLDPRPQLADLHRAILRSDPVLDLPAPGLDLAGPAPASAAGPGAGGSQRPATGAAAPSAAGIPAQLPADVPGFTGREELLDRLDLVLSERATGAGVCVISGMAGVGKTALALHWAHRARSAFPDGQLYVNLRGYDPGGVAIPADEALRALLSALGVAPGQLPTGTDAQSALYRSLLADRRVLVLLDNAREEEQVRPLLPGASGCLVVVTSRNQLPGLVVAEGAQPLSAHVLSTVEGVALLSRRLGPARMADAEAVERIVGRCAGLPLALVIVAARASLNTDLSLAALADQLGPDQDRLDALAVGRVVGDLRAVFSWSYQALSPAAAAAFRLFGLHPAADITAATFASLVGVAPGRAATLLAELAEAHVMTEHRPGRFTTHDLLRAYAADLVSTVDTGAARFDASARLADHCLHSAYAATMLIMAQRDPVELSTPRPAVTVCVPTDDAAAFAWFDAEQAGLRAVIEHAYALGLDRETWQLAWTLETYLNRRGLWPERLGAQRFALLAAERMGDRAAEARSYRGLGDASVDLGRDEQALQFLDRAIAASMSIGDRPGEGHAHIAVARVYERQGNYAKMLEHCLRSLELEETAGQTLGLARALNGVGWCHAQLGNYDEALEHCDRALALYREIGNEREESDAWDSLGFIHHMRGDHARAAEAYGRAVQFFRRHAERLGLAVTLDRLADNYVAAGDTVAACAAWTEAVTVLVELNRPEALAVSAKLAQTS